MIDERAVRALALAKGGLHDAKVKRKYLPKADYSGVELVLFKALLAVITTLGATGGTGQGTADW